ncbi:MAG: hypothetical protein KA152_01615 [Verrucomicrobiales bacterium]|nr:hypothetical protein [Verrucomicrobiales bacterium]
MNDRSEAIDGRETVGGARPLPSAATFCEGTFKSVSFNTAIGLAKVPELLSVD